ncbi:MAG: oligosaccharide flippase family protein [Paludibacter sp.]|nr:oligosaccharide flippase family protein [Paludibacter sp.]
MKDQYNKVKNIFNNNKKVVENYFFMTILQVLNSFFYLLIYPYLIRTLGLQSYGAYVFALSIVMYFITIVNFGFDVTGLKAIVDNADDKVKKAEVLSSVLTAKIYLETGCLILFSIIVFSIPQLRENSLLLYICFAQTIAYTLLPQWYFQGLQRMRVLTFVQLISKLLTLPFIFILIKTPADLNLFAVITSLGVIFSALTITFIIIIKDDLRMRWQPFKAITVWFKETLPFFLSNSMGSFKEQSIVVLAGALLGMQEVAVYDLANKIILVPRVMLMSINGALYPKISLNNTAKIVKRILKIETLIGILTIILIILFGKYVVIFMGGIQLVKAYPVSIILSVTVLSWLVVGAYHFFVFIPRNMYYVITKNQLIAFASTIIYLLLGFIFIKNIYVLAIAIALSGITEIIYSQFVTSKNKLLKYDV